MNRRAILVLFGALFLMIAMPAALSSPARQVTVEYHGSTANRLPPAMDGGLCPVSVNDPNTIDGAEDICLKIDTKPTERFVDVVLEDALGGQVPGFLAQDGGVRFGEFCGKTTKRVPIPSPGEPVYLFVQHGICKGQATLATSGDANFTFTR